jgi:hypothetical protein
MLLGHTSLAEAMMINLMNQNLINSKHFAPAVEINVFYQPKHANSLDADHLVWASGFIAR